MFEACLKVKKSMDKFGFPWFVAGDWAIDLFLKRETRTHQGIEIGIYRKQQMKLYRHFEKNKKWYIDNTSRIGKVVKKEWNKEYLRLPIHDVYIAYDDLEMKVVLHEKDEDHWLYTANPEIRLEESRAILVAENGIPYLCPEIVSLYKTRDMGDVDLEDIANALGKMNEAQRKWLIDSIKDAKTAEKIRNLATS